MEEVFPFDLVAIAQQDVDDAVTVDDETDASALPGEKIRTPCGHWVCAIGCGRLRGALPNWHVLLRVILEKEVEQDGLGQRPALDDDDSHRSANPSANGVTLALLNSGISNGARLVARYVEGVRMDEPARSLGEAQRCDSSSVSRREESIVGRDLADNLYQPRMLSCGGVEVGDLHERGFVVEKVEPIVTAVQISVDLVER